MNESQPETGKKPSFSHAAAKPLLSEARGGRERERALGTLHEALVRLPCLGLDWIGSIGLFFHSLPFHYGFSGDW
jgi:hypothetical protein